MSIQKLVNYCRKHGIKNFFELNKEELEEIVNNHKKENNYKKEHDKWGRKIGNTYTEVKR